MKLVYLREAYTLARFEREVCRRAAISAVTAEREKTLLDAIAPGRDVRVLPNGVDTDAFAARASIPEAPSVVFFGAMDYYANVDAAVFLVREVLPRLRARHSDFKVVIAGSRPTPEVQSLAIERGVTVTGYVQDIQGWVKGAAVCVIPLRVARGVQNKVLEAMAMGVPVIATPAAAEGIDATPGEHLLVQDDRDGGGAFARAILGLMDDRAKMASLAASARDLVVERYSWEPRARQLLGMLEEAIR